MSAPIRVRGSAAGDARDFAPALAQAPIRAAQACFRPVTQDGLPLLGPIAGIEGAFVATGHSVWGILNAPASGEAMAELIVEGADPPRRPGTVRPRTADGRLATNVPWAAIWCSGLACHDGSTRPLVDCPVREATHAQCHDADHRGGHLPSGREISLRVRPQQAGPRLAISTAVRLALERTSLSDALYHDVEHTVMVTLLGTEILRGRELAERVTAEDWLHMTVALLCHDVGYVRGACRGDTATEAVIDAAGRRWPLPRGASDAWLTPYHVDRSKIFVHERAEVIGCIDP